MPVHYRIRTVAASLRSESTRDLARAFARMRVDGRERSLRSPYPHTLNTVVERITESCHAERLVQMFHEHAADLGNVIPIRIAQQRDTIRAQWPRPGYWMLRSRVRRTPPK